MTLNELFDQISIFLATTLHEVMELPTTHILDWPIGYVIALIVIVPIAIVVIGFVAYVAGELNEYFWYLEGNLIAAIQKFFRMYWGRLIILTVIWFVLWIASLLILDTESIIVYGPPWLICGVLFWLSLRFGRKED